MIEVEGVSSARVDAQDGLLIETTDREKLQSELPRIAVDVRAGIKSLDMPDAGLEAVFDYLVEAGG